MADGQAQEGKVVHHGMRVTPREAAAIRFVSRSMNMELSHVLRRFSLDEVVAMYAEALSVAREEHVVEVGS